MTDRTLSPAESSNYEVLGNVQVTFTTGQSSAALLKAMAYQKLMEEAGQRYSGNIDIKNINISQEFVGILNGGYSVHANGAVVLFNRSASSSTGVENALTRAAEQASKNVPQRSKIAIVYITAQDQGTTDFITGELEYIWVNGGHTIIDRSQLDRIRSEQNFQMSGEVDDDTALSIGKFVGADIIVTGTVDGEGDLRRLRLRALDTQTAQVVGVASERL